MTPVAALSSGDGVIMFADTLETVGGYGKRNVDKLCVWNFPGRPFRFCISGATNDATYLDQLQQEIAGSLLSVPSYDLRMIKDALTGTLTDFYSKHIWPRPADRPQMEYLIAVQPLPRGMPDVFHVSETAVNILGITTHYKSIGVGSYLADYLIKLLLGGGEDIKQVIAAAIYVAREVRENIDGVGEVERLVVFERDGEYDEMTSNHIKTLEEILRFTNEITETTFSALAGDGILGEDDYQDAIMGNIRSMRTGIVELYLEWKKDRQDRKRLLELYSRRVSAS